MRTSLSWFRTLILAAVIVALALPAGMMAAETDAPRTASGRPNFTGNYNAATLTPLVRPKEFGDNLELTPEEAKEIAESEAALIEARSLNSDPDREAPPEGGDGSPGAAGNVGGYNTFWIDRGSEAFNVDGKFRTSIIVDPSDGQMPEMTPAAREARAARFAGGRRGNDGTAWWLDREGPGPYDDIETRSTAERCILGFTGAAPTFPSLYNNYKSIVQSDDYVMILIEMVHDARIVRMNSEHPPTEVRKWLGDSIGWWEDDTLVVETTNFHPKARMRGGSMNSTVTERFTKLDNGDVLYNFTLEDPDTWVTSWTGEYVWRTTSDKVYEYACHEGNYAMGNIMRGARMLEEDALSKQ